MVQQVQLVGWEESLLWVFCGILFSFCGVLASLLILFEYKVKINILDPSAKRNKAPFNFGRPIFTQIRTI